MDQLDDLAEDEHVYRFVPFNAWEDAPADGQSFLTQAFLSKGDFKPTADSYGASVWVVSTLDAQGGIAALEQLDPKLKVKGLIKVRVRDVIDCQIDVKLSPHDSDYTAHADAHASFVNIDRPKRDKLLDVCQGCIVRAPAYGSKRPP